MIVLVAIFFIQSYLSSWSQIRPGIIYPPEAEPVARFIEECMRQSSQRAIEEMGSTGGWVEIPAWIDTDITASLLLDQEGIRKIPYWHHNGESRIPTLSGMERSLATYVKNDLPDCIHNFTDLPNIKVRPLANLSTRAIIASDDVIIETLYPLEISIAEGRTVMIDSFQVAHQVRLKQLHDLGGRLMRFENDREFFENLTLDLLSANPEIPFTNLEFDCEQKEWTQDEIRSQIESTLTHNLQNIRVANTKFTPFSAPQGAYERLRIANEALEQELNDGLEDIGKSRSFPRDPPADAYEYFHSQIDVGQAPGDVRVAFQYHPLFGMYLRANPSSGGILRSQNVDGPARFIPFLCMNAYHFAYDIAYPIKVSLLDPTAFGGRGYIFSFAFPVQIASNKPTRDVMVRTFQEVPTREEFCTTLGDSFHEFRAVGIDADGFPSELADINMTYRCAGRRCLLGHTQAIDGRYALTTRIPSSCDNPTILATHGDYLPNETRIHDDITVLDLQHLKTLRASVQKRIYFADVGGEFRDMPESLGDEVAIINVRASGGLDEKLALPSNDSFIQLIDNTANYDVDIVLTRGEVIIGGYHTRNLTISADEIARAQSIMFNVIEYRPIPLTSDDRVRMMRFLQSEQYKEAVRPELG
ncbi:hypothetical protein HY641_00975 [Candidatus Woesearchaeota archaeon]|nr:hypothetical protein [Candidatus Woesearchaeota archaeon]